MHWDIYTGAAVISGASLILLAVLGGDSAARRMVGLVVGFAFMGYGVYVARQTTGTYYFPIVMFVIPVLGIVHFAKALVARRRSPAQFAQVQPMRSTDAVASQPPQMLDSWRSSQH